MTERLLALLPEAATVSICLDLAEAAASALEEARIEALHVIVDPAQLVAAAEEVAFQYLREKREGTAAQRAEATRSAFERWVRLHLSAPISPAWKQIVGAEQDSICAEAKDFDVVVVPRATNADGAEALHATIHWAGRPFFLAPVEWDAPSAAGIADRIVVAWNNTPACRRAAEGALPWLKLSRQSTILLVSEGEEVAVELTDRLTSEGVDYTIRSVARDDERLGDQIVSTAKELGATMLVAGAYRHNMLIEWLMGHTTHELMAHQEMVLFMAH